MEGSPFEILIKGNRCKKYFNKAKKFILCVEPFKLLICSYIILLFIDICVFGFSYKSLYFSFDIDYEKYLLNNPVFYDFFTYINGNIEFQKDKLKLIFINIPFAFINTIQIINIFKNAFKI